MTTVPSVWPTSKKTTLNGSVLIVVDTMVCPIHGTSAGAATMGGDATRRGATPKWGSGRWKPAARDIVERDNSKMNRDGRTSPAWLTPA
jgi:hypothetical protein